MYKIMDLIIFLNQPWIFQIAEWSYNITAICVIFQCTNKNLLCIIYIYTSDCFNTKLPTMLPPAMQRKRLTFLVHAVVGQSLARRHQLHVKHVEVAAEGGVGEPGFLGGDLIGQRWQRRAEAGIALRDEHRVVAVQSRVHDIARLSHHLQAPSPLAKDSGVLQNVTKYTGGVTTPRPYTSPWPQI